MPRLQVSNSYKEARSDTFALSSVPANTTNREDITINGVNENNMILIEMPDLAAGLQLVQYWIENENTVRLAIQNMTGGAIAPGSQLVKYIIL